MFCKNCGKEIDDKAAVCIHCGVPVKHETQQIMVTSPKSNGFAIAGFVLSFFGGILGLIFSIIGLQKSKQPEYNGNGRGLAIAGIILSCIALLIEIIVYASCGAALCAGVNSTTAVILPLV